jgi:hypothetical protein
MLAREWSLSGSEWVICLMSLSISPSQHADHYSQIFHTLTATAITALADLITCRPLLPPMVVEKMSRWHTTAFRYAVGKITRPVHVKLQ